MPCAGGDEFVVLMPGSTKATAERFARQLSALFRQYTRGTLPAECQAGLSIGIASLGHDAPADSQELLRCADARLYIAKRGGKDRIVGESTAAN